MKEKLNTIVAYVVRTIKNLREQIWVNMEIKRIYETLVALIRVVIRIITCPVLGLDTLVERVGKYVAQQKYKKPKEPTPKQIRSRMIALTLDTILENKNSVLGGRALKQWKMWAIVLLEMASFITTAIGMTIVASDVSPAIAIIWALVIQGLAGALSGIGGKWNNIILVVCLVFSITSDYVCYVNAVFPYDSYIEEQYTEFKTSYDLARERALELVGSNELSDEMVDNVCKNINNAMTSLKGIYNATKLGEIKSDLKDVERQLEKTDMTISEMTGYETSIDYNTNVTTESAQYSSPIINPRYSELISKKNILEAEITKMEDVIYILDTMDTQLEQIQKEPDRTWEDEVKDLVKKLSDSDTTADDLADAKKQYSALSVQVLEIEKKINNIINNEQNNMLPIEEYNLINMKKGDESYTQLMILELPDFNDLKGEVEEKNHSVFDIFFENAAEFIDSEFAVNAVDLKGMAQRKTEQVYADFIEASAGLANEDEELWRLIYGPASEDVSVLPLVEAKANNKYDDALTKALTYLIEPEDDVIKTYSRVAYACLADGLVLMIGFSMRRKKTSIYRVCNRRDLTNEEPRLISEAFYNLSAKPLNGDDGTTYQITTLLAHLNTFIEYFEITPFIQDTNLKNNYRMVCRAENVEAVNTEFKELIGLLQDLGYVKHMSVKQYQFFKEYKLNKAAMEKNNLINELPSLNKKDDEYCYLMTEGFALYFYEKMNDLYQNIETNAYRDEIFKEINAGLTKEDK